MSTWNWGFLGLLFAAFLCTAGAVGRGRNQPTERISGGISLISPYFYICFTSFFLNSLYPISFDWSSFVVFRWLEVLIVVILFADMLLQSFQFIVSSNVVCVCVYLIFFFPYGVWVQLRSNLDWGWLGFLIYKFLTCFVWDTYFTPVVYLQSIGYQALRITSYYLNPSFEAAMLPFKYYTLMLFQL